MPVITYAKDGKRRTLRKWIIRLSIGAAGIAAVFAIGIAWFLWMIFGETSFNPKDATAITTAITNHTLVPDAAGIVHLPPSLSGQSRDGNAYVRTDPNGAVWILLPTWRGKGANLRGYAFTTAAAPAAVPSRITVTGPMPVAPFAEKLDVDVIAPPVAGWYHVSFSLD
jgi:hypothetical protein